MVSANHIKFNAADRSYFAILKKEIHAIAATANFSSNKLGEIDIVVAEIVSNLSKHAQHGELLVKLVKKNGIQGIEIISLDSGPGITDIPRMVIDGVSTKNTLGQGLGSIKRLSEKFQIYSQKGWGTIMLSRIFNDPSPLHLKPDTIEINSIVIPKTGEKACGDRFCSIRTDTSIKLFLGDGLGHGPEAAAAVAEAAHAFAECNSDSSLENIRHIHSAVKRTRGLVGTVIIFDLQEKKWNLCGVGNVATVVQSAEQYKNYLSYNGILGLNIPNSMKEQEILYDKGQHVIMCSDGIKSRWNLVKHPSVMRYDMSVLAAVIYKDYNRNNDDTSIATCKITI
jgi:anti-sigma regulatory factor (Ser/Thr protein kinase)